MFSMFLEYKLLLNYAEFAQFLLHQNEVEHALFG